MCQVVVTAHWRQRVGERIGSGVCPDELARALLWAIDHRRDDLVRFVGRVRRDGVRAFRFRVPDGRIYLALINVERRSVVTVLQQGHEVRLSRGETVGTIPDDGGPQATPVPRRVRVNRRRRRR